MAKFIDTQGIAQYLREAYDKAPYAETILAILDAVANYMEWLDSVAKQIPINPETQSGLTLWNRERDNFERRMEEYYAAAEGAESQEDLEAFATGPLFGGNYPRDMDLISPPDWPDIETAFRLTNDLIAIFDHSEMLDEGFYDSFRSGISSSIDLASMQLASEQEGWDEKVETALGDAGEYIGELKDKIDDYIGEKIGKETAKAIQPLLIAGVGAIALIALARSRR